MSSKASGCLRVSPASTPDFFMMAQDSFNVHADDKPQDLAHHEGLLALETGNEVIEFHGTRKRSRHEEGYA